MNRGFGGLHPIVSFLFYAGVALFSLLFFHPVYLVTEIVLLAVLISLHGMGMGRKLGRALPFYFILGGIVAIANPIFSHRGWIILFYFMDQPVTLEAILYGVFTMLTILAVLLMFVSYQHVITTDKFMYLFSAFAPQLALHIWMTIRFVPLFVRRFKEIRLIQGTRGINIRSGGLRKRIRDAGLLLRILLTWSLEDAMRTGDSMKARGYGTARRTAYYPYRMDRRDRVILAVFIFVLLALLGGRLYGLGLLTIYPRLETMQLTSTGEWVHYALFCVFLLIPIAIEGGERYRWRSLKRSA